MSRQLLRLIAGTLIGFLLFAQMAIAAYACPGQTKPKMQMPVMESVNDNFGHAVFPAAVDQKTNCEDMEAATMDPDNANLCSAHCQFGQQNHQVSALTVPVALFMALYVKPTTPDLGSTLRPVATSTSALVAASPPHAILHCCFRI